jgi:signal peptide peptidase SppA
MFDRYPHIAARIFNRPLLLAPDKLDAIVAFIGTRVGLPASALPRPHAYATQHGERRRGGYRVQNRVAMISMSGILVHRSAFDAHTSEPLLGYDDIGRMVDAAAADKSVDAIVLEINSPGGEVSGAFQTAEKINRAAQVKPIHAVSDGLAASAAYLLASASTSITVASTALTGSIGVVLKHVDVSRAIEAEGVRVTEIFAGRHKVDGSAFAPLPDDVRARLQAMIDDVYNQFTSAVARYRDMAESAVRATEAETFLGAEAIAAGLADFVGTTDDVLERIATSAARHSTLAAGNTEMAPSASISSLSARIREIFSCDEARAPGRLQAAVGLAIDSDLPVPNVKTILASMGTAKPAKTSLQLAGNVIVGPDIHEYHTDAQQEHFAGQRAIQTLKGANANEHKPTRADGVQSALPGNSGIGRGARSHRQRDDSGA